MSILILKDLERAFGDDLNNDEVTEISVNQPYAYFIALKGTRNMQKKDNPELSYALLKRLAEGIATSTNQTISEAQPLLSAQIPSPQHEGLYFRIQFVRDPAVTQGTIALSIRKPSILNVPYSSYESILNSVSPFQKISAKDRELLMLYQHRQFYQFLHQAVASEKNIIISAETGAGKTTLLNSLIQDAIPLWERLITIEDAKELRPLIRIHYNCITQEGGKVRLKLMHKR